MTRKTFAGFSALQRAENSSILNLSQSRLYHNRFSALQRAENSSMTTGRGLLSCITVFQCSSASRKFLNRWTSPIVMMNSIPFQCSSASRKFLNVWRYCDIEITARSFSALQRAENSSIDERRTARRAQHARFSALQRAENSSILLSYPDRYDFNLCFSALQRAENSSIDSIRMRIAVLHSLFQCSSASRKFLNSGVA